MQAWTTFGDGIAALRAVTVELPTPGPAEVLVRVRALSLNFRDLLVIEGVSGWRPSAPVIPISDAVGEVVATGDRVSRFAVGDRVLAAFLPRWRDGQLTAEVYTMPVGGPVNRGMLAEYVVVDEEEAVHAPVRLDDVRAATLPVAGVTAWHALSRTAPRTGETVLVHGTGGVALYAAQIAVALGARVIVTSSSDVKLQRVRDLGVSATINYRTDDVAARVRQLTDGAGADVVVETIGGSNLDVSLEALRIGGRIAFIGLIAGVKAEISTYLLVTKNATIHGIETGSRAMLEELVSFVDEQGLEPVIDSTYSWNDVPEALAHLKSGSHFGKVTVALASSSDGAGPA
ncbi:zinc-dependent alcohol dehydrogenase family protein [Microbacterium sp. CPCC 204701]|uniref:zinc-dependent alcohol dehydrogenase family protein n=1 Tax=Microbacterium sp. CPCC 204701 TaxID=2493084 RepID=UPI000FDA68F0|nr:NAD(P)-dependent alcohol dehydrogenase [Microbacterium sp. CPCC 204701]